MSDSYLLAQISRLKQALEDRKTECRQTEECFEAYIRREQHYHVWRCKDAPPWIYLVIPGNIWSTNSEKYIFSDVSPSALQEKVDPDEFASIVKFYDGWHQSPRW